MKNIKRSIKLEAMHFNCIYRQYWITESQAVVFITILFFLLWWGSRGGRTGEVSGLCSLSYPSPLRLPIFPLSCFPGHTWTLTHTHRCLCMSRASSPPLSVPGILILISSYVLICWNYTHVLTSISFVNPLQILTILFLCIYFYWSHHRSFIHPLHTLMVNAV